MQSHPEQQEKARERARQWRASHRSQHREYQHEYHQANPEQREKWLAANKDRVAGYNRKRRYGITEDEYQSMLRRQGGVCALCGRPETANGRARLAVDHEHGSGRPRGLLCIGCNISLGYYERGWRSRLDPDVVERYLRRNR